MTNLPSDGASSRLDREASLSDLDAFPADFRWGLATAAYQIEGAANDGRARAEHLGHVRPLARRGPCTATPATSPATTTTAGASDLDLLADLGVTDYRLSVSLVAAATAGAGPAQPRGRGFLPRAARRAARARRASVRHVLPLGLASAARGCRRLAVWVTAERFADYADLAVTALGDLAEDWITLNEPWCSAFLGYGEGPSCPGPHQRTPDAVAAAHHLNLAHGLAVAPDACRAGGGYRIGVSHLITDIVPASGSPADQEAADPAGRRTTTRRVSRPGVAGAVTRTRCTRCTPRWRAPLLARARHR